MGSSAVGGCAAGSTFQKVIILKGKGNDGKSTLARIIIAAMPKGSVTSIAPQAFDREFSRAELVSSLLNVVSELPEGDLLDSGPAKAVTVGDPDRNSPSVRHTVHAALQGGPTVDLQHAVFAPRT